MLQTTAPAAAHRQRPICATTAMQNIADAFETEVLALGLTYYDVGSYAAQLLQNVRASERYFFCNYMEKDIYRYIPPGWPDNDPIAGIFASHAGPFDYHAALRTAPKTLATQVHRGIFRTSRIREAWAFPFNTLSELRFVTVYRAGGRTSADVLTPEVIRRIEQQAAALVNRLSDLDATRRSRPVRSRNDRSLPTLSDRESACMAMVAAGNSNSEIAQKLEITTHTVRYHLKRAYRKFGVSSRLQAIRHFQQSTVTQAG